MPRVSCLLLLVASLAQAIQTETHGLHAVPPPGPVTIDGRLDDWDLSGATLMCYDVEALRDVYSATVAMMYNADYLYVSLHWKDPTPLGNRHDPRFEAHKAWAGDCVQLRLRTDEVTHVDAWCFGPALEPAIHYEHGKSLTDAFGGPAGVLRRTTGWKLEQGAEMAFQKDADGHGYVQELALPWKLIAQEHAYRAGDSFVCGFELLWGKSDWPVHRYADNLQPGTSSREFFWTATNSWGPVVLEPSGKLKLPPPEWQRQLEPDAVQGPVAIGYDLPRAARVTLAVDTDAGVRVRNLVAAAQRPAGHNVERWDGLDDDGKPAPPGHYRFRALYHDGIHVRYAMSFANPGNPTWDTPDGRGAFYADHTAPEAAAAGGQVVALACPMGEGGKHLIGCDLSGQRLWGLANRTAFDGGHIALATDGTTLWVGNEGKQITVYRAELATGRYSPWQRAAGGADVLDLPVSDQPGQTLPEGNLSALALGPERTLAVCLRGEGKVKLLDADSGAVRSELSVPEPRAAVWLPTGRLLVLAGERLLTVSREGQTAPFGTTTWPGGFGLAADAQGRVYLSVRAPDHNVKVFSPEGRLLREIGQRGGRAVCGPYNAAALRNPGRLAVDSQGRLWVPEATTNPKRTSVWSPDGKLLKDLVGTSSYSGAGSIDAADPTLAFSDNTVYRLNLAQGTWRPVWSFGRRDDPADLFPPVADSRSKVVHVGGRTLIYTTDTARGANEAHVTLFDGRGFRSAAHLGIVASRDYVEQWAKYQNPLFAGHAGQLYAWSDANGDGLVQAAELSFAPSSGARSCYWGQLPDAAGALAYLVEGQNALLVLPISGYTACGAPRYDVAHPQRRVADRPLVGRGNGEGMVVGGADGTFYVNQDPLIAVDPAGHVLGGYPNHHTSVHGSHTATAAKAGFLIGPSSILGTAVYPAVGEVVDLNGNLGENYLFTRDGLWVQSLFKDVRGGFETPTQAVRGMPMDATTAGGESFGGNFIRDRQGKTWLTIGGTDARVLEVTGLDSVRRFAGEFDFDQAAWVEAQKLAAERAARKLEPHRYTVTRAATAPTVDGKTTEWPELLDDAKTAVQIAESPQQRYGRVAARWDDAALYVAWRVWAPSDRPRNAGQDWRLLFKSGDAVDLMLGSPDQRLLVATLGGQPVLVRNVKTDPAATPADGFDFSSPWRTIHFARVQRIAAAKVAIGPAPGGWCVEAAIPWEALGIVPQAGQKLKADAGVLAADNGGTVTVARHYWSNPATGLVNDVPGEADLQPALWGEWALQ